MFLVGSILVWYGLRSCPTDADAENINGISFKGVRMDLGDLLGERYDMWLRLLEGEKSCFLVNEAMFDSCLEGNDTFLPINEVALYLLISTGLA